MATDEETLVGDRFAVGVVGVNSRTRIGNGCPHSAQCRTLESLPTPMEACCMVLPLGFLRHDLDEFRKFGPAEFLKAGEFSGLRRSRRSW